MRAHRPSPGQGAVIICNHRCSLDPAFIGLMVNRIVHWMVAKEYWEIPVLGWFFRTCQCIPVSRGGIDTAATKIAIRYASQGRLVGMLPEGRINETEQLLLPACSGFVLVALKARVPIIPCYIQGRPVRRHRLGMHAHACQGTARDRQADRSFPLLRPPSRSARP